MNNFEPLYEYVNPPDMPGVRHIPIFIDKDDYVPNDNEQSIFMFESFTVTGGSLVTIILVILLILLLI